MYSRFRLVSCEVVDRGYERCLALLDKLRGFSLEERKSLYLEHQQWFSSNDVIDLESLVVNPRPSSLERFKLWFFLIGVDFLVGPNAGCWNYERYLKAYPKKGMNSYKFSHMVLLAFSMMGYIDGLQENYSNHKSVDEDGFNAHGRIFRLNLLKVYGWIEDDANWLYEQKAKGWSGKMDKVLTFDVEDDTWNSYPEWQSSWQRESISALSLIPEAKSYAEEILEKYAGVDIFKLDGKDTKEDLSPAINAYMLNLIYQKFLYGAIGSFKVDSYAGRCYTTLTNMASGFRLKYLRMQGEKVAEVDVGSAQPFFIGVRVLKEKGVSSKWLNACVSGDFYLWVKEVTGYKGKRKEVKKHLMQYIYSCNDKSKVHKPQYYKFGYGLFSSKLDAYLKANDRAVYDYIQHFKNHPVKSKNGQLKSELPKMMQGEEVEYIQQCLKELAGKVLCYNIHDCICCKMSEAERVKDVMIQVGLERYGEYMKINVETEETEAKKSAL